MNIKRILKTKTIKVSTLTRIGSFLIFGGKALIAVCLWLWEPWVAGAYLALQVQLVGGELVSSSMQLEEEAWLKHLMQAQNPEMSPEIH